jgi:hypothetical protein
MQLKMTLIAVALVLGGVMGWMVNGWRLNAEIATIQAQHAVEVATANAQAVQNLQAAQVLGSQLTDELLKSQRKSQAGTNLIKRKIDDAEKSAPVACTFPAEWVQLYNASLNPDADSQGSSTSSATH